MRRYLSLLMVLLIVVGTSAQNQPRVIIDIPTEQKPWSSIEWNRSIDQFQFAVVTDRTGGHRPGIFLKGIQKLNLLQPEFVMSVGDLIEGYTEDEVRLDAEWTEFMGFIDSLDAPFFYVPGNHDITNKVMEDKWKELFGVTYYSFVYNDVLFLCLNSEDNLRGSGRGSIDDEQYEWIKKTLEENQEVKWTMVFQHQPMWIQDDPMRWPDVEQLLEGRPHHVFAGHYHRYWKRSKGKGNYIALATTGGGSGLRGPAYGEFDHVVWITMTEEGPILANLMLDGIWDENVVTEDIVELVRNRPYPVKVEPIYVASNALDQITAEVKITNDSDYPMTARIKSNTHSALHYSLEKDEVMVQPNDVVTLPLELENVKGAAVNAFDPIKLDAEVTYTYEGRPDIVVPQTINFAPVYKQTISKAPKKVKIDGDLKEWSGAWITFDPTNMNGKPFDYRGEKDLSIKFSTSYDDENFYLAFDIMDDEVYADGDRSLWQQDALIVALDARPTHISAMNDGGGRNREWLAYLRT
ncbi:MAG: metallophosphoesterase, partial [Bacteroidota bacterium]